MKTLENFREEIDLLDQKIVETIGNRLALCKEIALYKKEYGIPMMQSQRVDHVKQKNALLGKAYHVDPEFMINLYTLIINETCRLEDEIIEDLSNDGALK